MSWKLWTCVFGSCPITWRCIHSNYINPQRQLSVFFHTVWGRVLLCETRTPKTPSTVLYPCYHRLSVNDQILAMAWGSRWDDWSGFHGKVVSILCSAEYGNWVIFTLAKDLMERRVISRCLLPKFAFLNEYGGAAKYEYALPVQATNSIGLWHLLFRGGRRTVRGG